MIVLINETFLSSENLLLLKIINLWSWIAYNITDIIKWALTLPAVFETALLLLLLLLCKFLHK